MGIKINNIVIHSNKIIGLMGDYEDFLNSLNTSCVSKVCNFKKKIVIDEIYLYTNDNKLIKSILNEFKLEDDFLNKNIDNLSNNDKRLLEYIIVFLENKKVIVIDEPFLYLDYSYKKLLISLIKKIVFNTNKTIIVASRDSNIIYSLCDKILFIKKDKYFYGDISNFSKKKLLDLYNIDMPNLVEFTLLARRKGKNIDYSNNINDLIKDVYRNV